jgi:hypothetical protein
LRLPRKGWPPPAIAPLGRQTGFWLSELTHPLAVLKDAGLKTELASVRGGQPPIDGFDLSDKVNALFWSDKEFRTALGNTRSLAEVDSSVKCSRAGEIGPTLLPMKATRTLSSGTASSSESRVGAISGSWSAPGLGTWRRRGDCRAARPENLMAFETRRESPHDHAHSSAFRPHARGRCFRLTGARKLYREQDRR